MRSACEFHTGSCCSCIWCWTQTHNHNHTVSPMNISRTKPIENTTSSILYCVANIHIDITPFAFKTPPRCQKYSETSLSGHSVRRPPLYRGHLCKSPMLLFPYIVTSVKRPPHYKGQFCMALCDRYKEVSLYN